MRPAHADMPSSEPEDGILPPAVMPCLGLALVQHPRELARAWSASTPRVVGFVGHCARALAVLSQVTLPLPATRLVKHLALVGGLACV